MENASNNLIDDDTFESDEILRYFSDEQLEIIENCGSEYQGNDPMILEFLDLEKNREIFVSKKKTKTCFGP